MLFKHKTFVYFSRKLRRALAFEYFISKKTLKSVVQGKKVSKPIVRISVISIALAVIVNLITVAVVTGFQQEVRQKVSGFGSHIFIMNGSEGSIYESEPIRVDQPIMNELNEDPRIASIHPVGYKPVLFQSRKTEVSYTLPNGKDTTEIQQQVHGAIIKGVNNSFDWSFFREHLLEGEIPDFEKETAFDQIVISKKLSNDLNFQIGDTVNAFFVKNTPIKQPFLITGIYETGLEEFDKKIVLGDLKSIQVLNDWGIRAEIEVADTMYDGQLIIKGNVSGGNGNFRYDWGKGFEAYSGFTLCPIKDTIIRLIASDYWSDVRVDIEETSIPDTAYLHIHIEGNAHSHCDVKTNDFDEIERTYLNDNGTEYKINAGQKTIFFESIRGAGSSHNYVGGFEITIKDWNTLDAVVLSTSKKVDFIPTQFNELLKTTSIKDNQRDIFVWLDFLDINVIIILTLMVLIGIINMGSALLVLILIRSNFIGMMKAMGATNWSIRKIFLIQATFLIGRGLIWGNIIGLGICFAQKYFGIFTLNPEVYYLTEVPIQLNLVHWLLLNAGTLLVCILALIIPSVVITRINPVKAIKFN